MFVQKLARGCWGDSSPAVEVGVLERPAQIPGRMSVPAASRVLWELQLCKEGLLEPAVWLNFLGSLSHFFPCH